ncbi:MAG: NADH-ubiquinone oxidoreductase-F iron-sulfur binding region domain-containing protein [Actinomycetota bacterium]
MPLATQVTDGTEAPPSSGQRRLLADFPAGGSALSLAEHRSRYPQPPPPKHRPLAALIEEIDHAGLRGRGGAGFPTATKMRAVAAGRGTPFVVANGTEGEPGSYKDKLLLTSLPHLVIDGVLLAAAAVGADQAVIAIEHTAGLALAAMDRALAERRRAEPLPIPVEVAETPPGYVTGEESALVHYLNGGDALPTATPPRPFERGLARRPTLVDNVETLAHVAQIARYGAGWFRTTGTRDEPGTMLVTVSGAVAQPGVTEVPLGTPLGAIIERANPTARPVAALVGGYFGGWVPAAQFGAPLSRAGLRATGAAPGAGVIIVLPEGACGLSETARILQWYANESAGQCGPCAFGLPAIAAEAVALCHGPIPPQGLGRLQRWAGDVEGRGACHHPNGAVRLLRSALMVFSGDIERHLHGQPCTGSYHSPVVPVPGLGRGNGSNPRHPNLARR